MIAIAQADDATLLRLQSLMDDAGKDFQFTELDPFGERHGSWQRTIHSFRAGLDRYVLVALTGLEDCAEIAVTAGAQERIQSSDSKAKPGFRRFDVGTVRIDTADPALWPSDVQRLIEQGIRMAVEIHPLQLEAQSTPIRVA